MYVVYNNMLHKRKKNSFCLEKNVKAPRLRLRKTARASKNKKQILPGITPQPLSEIYSNVINIKTHSSFGVISQNVIYTRNSFKSPRSEKILCQPSKFKNPERPNLTC